MSNLETSGGCGLTGLGEITAASADLAPVQAGDEAHPLQASWGKPFSLSYGGEGLPDVPVRTDKQFTARIAAIAGGKVEYLGSDPLYNPQIIRVGGEVL